MRKIAVLIVALLALQTSTYAQKQECSKQVKGHEMKHFSAEEMAILQTKKMTLHLDLTKSQQSRIQEINLENAIKRKAIAKAHKAKKESGHLEKPTKEARFKRINAKLDHKIAMKAKMKDILNDEQYAKWQKGVSERGNKKRGKKREMCKNKKETCKNKG